MRLEWIQFDKYPCNQVISQHLFKTCMEWINAPAAINRCCAEAIRTCLSPESLTILDDECRYGLKSALIFENVFSVQGVRPVSRQHRIACISPPSEIAMSIIGIAAALNLKPMLSPHYFAGAWLHSIAPSAATTKLLELTGAKEDPHTDFVYGDFHCDEASRVTDKSPEYLIMACIQNEESIPTFVYSVSDIVAAISLEDRQLLSSPIFTTRTPSTWGFIAEKTQQSVLQYKDDNWIAKFDTGLVYAESPRASAALSVFAEVCKKFQFDLPLKPGQLLVLPNHHYLHGRPQVHDGINFPKRWLLRSYWNLSEEQRSGDR